MRHATLVVGIALVAGLLATPGSAGAQELTSSQLELAERLLNAQGAPSKTSELKGIIQKMSGRQRAWLADALDRYPALKEQPGQPTPYGSVRTDLSDGRWAWQIVAGPRTVTIAVKRSGRASVTSMRTPGGAIPDVPAPFTLSQAAVMQLPKSQQRPQLSQYGEIGRVNMKGVNVPTWNAFGRPSTRADFRQVSRPTSPRKLK